MSAGDRSWGFYPRGWCLLSRVSLTPCPTQERSQSDLGKVPLYPPPTSVDANFKTGLEA